MLLYSIIVSIMFIVILIALLYVNFNFKKILNNLKEKNYNYEDEIESISTELSELLKNISNGKLNYRISENKYQSKIIDDINKIIDKSISYLDKSPNMILLFDRQFNLQYANKAVEVYSLNKNEIVGKNLQDFIDDSGLQEYKNAVNIINSNGLKLSKFEREFKAKSGEIMYQESNVCPIMYDNQIVGYISISIDISELKKEKIHAKLVADYRNGQVRKLSEALDDFSNGKLNFKYNHIDAYIEKSDVVQTFKTFFEKFEYASNKIYSYVKHLENIFIKFSNNDFTPNDSVAFSGDFKKIGESINEVPVSMSSLVDKIKISSDSLNEIASNVRDSSSELSNSFEMQFPVIKSIENLLDKYSQESEENAKTSLYASELSTQIQTAAHDGSNIIEEMSTSMDNIKDSSNEVFSIVSIVDNIAFQTNLLAINAMIEAARAGEHGKSFAVVADEVRSLAQRSANSAKEISELLENSISYVEQGAKTTNRTREEFSKIVDLIDRITVELKKITELSRNQSSEIYDLTSKMEDLNHLIKEDSVNIITSAEAAEKLYLKSEHLGELISNFKTS